MKIAVIGSRGFVGSNVARHLSNSNTVVSVTRNTLDLLDPIAVQDFLKKEMFDVVVNCAAVMTDNNLIHDARNNLGMFINFYQNSNYFGKFINTGSGAEFDRTLDINSTLESQLFSRMPKDSYGWGQNIKSRLCYDKKDFYTIRIFNCFGAGESDTRIFPRLLREGSLEISNDRYFDYFSIQDLNKVIDHCIEYTWLNKDINAVYEQKYKISEVVDKFCRVNQLEPNFKVISTSNNNYTGSGHLLSTMNIKLDGLEKGLEDYLK